MPIENCWFYYLGAIYGNEASYSQRPGSSFWYSNHQLAQHTGWKASGSQSFQRIDERCTEDDDYCKREEKPSFRLRWLHEIHASMSQRLIYCFLWHSHNSKIIYTYTLLSRPLRASLTIHIHIIDVIYSRTSHALSANAKGAIHVKRKYRRLMETFALRAPSYRHAARYHTISPFQQSLIRRIAFYDVYFHRWHESFKRGRRRQG